MFKKDLGAFMSYQTPHYFDPTALLMIKVEVDQSITAVESTVNALVEDQTLPFAIDDALHQIEQCGQVLSLIDMPEVGKIAQYCAELMRKIMQKPEKLNMQEVEALSEGTTMLKRYLEFASLQEVNVPVLLLDSLNRLELALGKPLTQNGAVLAQFFDGRAPNLTLPQAEQTAKSNYIHQLYKLSLCQLLKHKKTVTDLNALKLVGVSLANVAQGLGSEQYWNLVNIAFAHVEGLHLTDARLRVFIRLEQKIGEFLESSESFRASVNDISDVLALCLVQNSDVANVLRQQLNLPENIYFTYEQEYQYLQQFYSPSDETVREVCKLLREEINDIRREVEYNYQNLSSEQIQELQQKLYAVACVMKVLNLEHIYELLSKQADALVGDGVKLQSETFAQDMMNSVLSATNALGLLEREYISNRLQLGVFNTEIVLDQVEKAYESVLNESKHDIVTINQQFMDYVREPSIDKMSEIADKLSELSGAALFLGQTKAQLSLINSARFIKMNVETNTLLETQQINLILDVLAAMDLFVENLLNKQPVLSAMFDTAVKSSEQLS